EMERLYAAVMEHDELKSTGSLPTKETHISQYPPEFQHLRGNALSSRPASPPLRDNTKSPARTLTTSPQKSIRPSPIMTHSRNSSRSSFSSFGKKRGIRNLPISPPMGSPDIVPQHTGQYGETEPLSPRLYNPGPPPPTPPAKDARFQRSKPEPVNTSISSPRQGSFREALRTPRTSVPTFQPVPEIIEHPASQEQVPTLQRPTFTSPKNKRAPAPLSLKTGQASVGSTGALPLRSAPLPLRNLNPNRGANSYTDRPPSMIKATVLERKVPDRSLGTPRTGVPMTPYSPYMPFTPLTPMTPSRLVTREERKQKEREEGRRVVTVEDRVEEEKFETLVGAVKYILPIKNPPLASTFLIIINLFIMPVISVDAVPGWPINPHLRKAATPTKSTTTTKPTTTGHIMTSSIGNASPPMQTPAADNLRDAISFRYKKPPPRSVTYLPNQIQIGQQLQMPNQAPVAGASQPQAQPQQPQQLGIAQTQQFPGLTQQPVTSMGQAPLGLPVPSLPQQQQQQQVLQAQLPTSASADPVRYTTWGPKTVYYVDNLLDSEPSKKGSSKKKSNKKGKKDKKKTKEDIKFQRVTLNGSEQMQTTEKIEVLGLEEGGGVRRTWVCITRTEVVSVEKQVEEKDVVVESSDDEESASGSDDSTSDDEKTDKEERRKKKGKKGTEKRGNRKQAKGKEMKKTKETEKIVLEKYADEEQMLKEQHYCGCSYTVNYTKHYLPQVQLDAHTTILSNISRTTLKQTFSNPSASDSIKQCIYTFPMYDGVSVVAFTCRIGSRVLKGLVKERSQAKATYDKAVSRGETAGLLEQLPQASDVFSTRLGNIPANEKIHVEITYVGELKHDAEADGIRHTLPTHIAPRYGSLPNSRLEGSTAKKTGGISMTVDVSIAEGSFIRGLQSPTHPIAVTMGNTSASTTADPAMHQASATLALGSTELDKDFVLIVLTKDTGVPKALLETHPDIPNQRAMLLTLVPKFSLPRSNPEIVFVADRSGSMGGNIPTLISALKVFLKSLPVGVKFNICSFGSDHSFLWPKSQAYSRDSVTEALAHVEGFHADFGGTETFAALKATIDNRYKDIPCEVMLLTDGDIWSQGSLFAYLNDEVKKSKSSLRIFALGIGDGVSHALIEGVARAGNGFAQTVNNHEKLDSKVIRMLKGGLSPHTTDYNLEVKYQDADEGFEMVDKVTDALKVMLSENTQTAKPEAKENDKPMSFFDPSTAQSDKEKPPSADNENADPFAHLPAISVPKIMQTPQSIPPLYPFSRTSVYLLFSGDSIQKTPKSVVLRANSEHGPLELEIPVESISSPGRTIHQLAARKAIQELEEGRGWIYEAHDGKGKPVTELYASRFDEMVQREAVRIGVQFQVGGKWCSFVAVKDNDQAKGGLSSDVDGDIDVLRPASEDEHTKVEAEVDVIDYSDDDMGFGAFGQSPPRAESGGDSGYDPTLCADMSSPSFSPASPVRTAECGFASTRGPPTRRARSRPQYKYADMAKMVLTSDKRFSTRRSGGMHGLHGLHRLHRFFSGTRGRDTDTLASKPHASTPNEKVHSVISLQDFEGWWSRSEQLYSIMGVSMTPNSKRDDKWVTALVLKWLDVKMVAEKDVWELVAEKAKSWLDSLGLREDELKRIEEEVAKYLE
ncbi:MAG: hypothetical protein Q9180_003187, partial [Flavoplaca navasiana]